MISKITKCLQQNVWVLMASFLAFASSAFVGSLTVDSGTSTPFVWLLAMWAMLAVGGIIIIVVVLECLLALLGSDGG